MQNRSRLSLRLTLIDRLVPAMMILFLLSGGASYWIALSSATKAYDRGLLGTAFAIGEQLRIVDGKPRLSLSPQGRSILLADKFDQIFYAVRSADGELLDGDGSLAMPIRSQWLGGPTDRRTYYDGTRGEEPIRIAALRKQIGEQTVTILAAETTIKRDEMVHDLLVGMLPSEFILMLLAGLVIWSGIRVGLQPLERLRAELAKRSQTDLRPISLAIPEEVQPVADELNLLLARIEDMLAAQRNFVSDAAHQLRTPIAALLAQVDAARQDIANHEPMNLDGIHAATRRLSHLATQLLSLARAEPADMQQQTLDLAETVLQAGDIWLPRAIAQQIDLGFELAESRVAGSPLMIGEMLSNLVDNALRHTPPGGSITVSCGQTGYATWLQVEDSGPGIPESARERIFERFYRPPGESADGCGLGLAIVRQIVRQHDGEVTAGQSARHGGALFRVVLPTANPPPAA